jgi:hypothetical protein
MNFDTFKRPVSELDYKLLTPVYKDFKSIKIRHDIYTGFH